MTNMIPSYSEKKPIVQEMSMRLMIIVKLPVISLLKILTAFLFKGKKSVFSFDENADDLMFDGIKEMNAESKGAQGKKYILLEFLFLEISVSIKHHNFISPSALIFV